MPGVYFEQIQRRDFVVQSLGSIGVATLWSPLCDAASGTDSNELHLALLSDTHIPADPKNEYRKFRPAENLKKVVPQVVAAKPEGVIINGDAARLKGLNEDYVALKESLKPVAKIAPIYIGMGNHDDRKNFDKVFNDKPGKQFVGGKHVVMIKSPLVNVIVLDSLLYVNKVAGLLGKIQRNWLKKNLPKLSDKPCVMFVHHTLGDGDGDLLDSERLFRLIKPFPHVQAIFYGHSHRYSFDRRDAAHLINLPAVGYNFNDKEPVGWVDAKFSKSGFSLTLHAIGGNTDGHGKTIKKTWG